MTSATGATISRIAAVMTVIAMGLAYAIIVADPTILSANMSEVVGQVAGSAHSAAAASIFDRNRAARYS